MKIKKLACKNCGAKLEIEEGASQVKCNFCGSTFSVEDDYNKGYNYTKGVLKATDEHMKENLKPVGIIPALFFVIIFIIFVVFVFYSVNSHKTFTDFEDKWDENSNEIDKKSFNFQYESISGKKSSFIISGVLDKIVTNNKTNKNHVITVVYKDMFSTEETKIKEIRDMLDDYEYYDVSLDYDSAGYVNKFTITDINN